MKLVFAVIILTALVIVLDGVLIDAIRGSRPGRHVDDIANSKEAFDAAMGPGYKPPKVQP